MALELYFYNECGFSQSVLNCVTNLHCEDKIVKKDIRENPEYEKELIALCGAKTVPVLVIDGKPVKGSEEITQYLVSEFLWSRAGQALKGAEQIRPFFLQQRSAHGAGRALAVQAGTSWPGTWLTVD
jgi:glutaredoxin-related protein